MIQIAVFVATWLAIGWASGRAFLNCNQEDDSFAWLLLVFGPIGFAAGMIQEGPGRWLKGAIFGKTVPPGRASPRSFFKAEK